MKKIMFFLFSGVAVVLNLYTVMAQAPQGFTYQALVTNSSGSPIANTTMDVKIAILSDPVLPVYVWEEQQSVTTNGSGVFSLTVGQGTKLQGSATSFSSISWTASPLYIRTQVFFQGSWKMMGTARLWSVPFSLVSAAAEGLSSGARLEVVSSDDASQEPLFEVKRKDGQTVFAVYSDAVNVFLPNSSVKGRKGGFAIGGFDMAKGTSQDLFSVTSDSIRMYINDNPPSKPGTKGGFAIGGFTENKGSMPRYLSLYGYSTVDTIYNASQILWYPRKEAFMAGNIDIENPDSVGKNSFSTGYKNKAIGDYSHALGYEAIARGNFSTAIGRSAVAGQNSFALGNFSSALGNDSYAIGSASYALANNSVALGVRSKSSGFGSLAIGFESEASFEGSVAIGYQSKAKAFTAHTFGLKAEASGYGSLALGMYSKATSNFSTTLGFWSEATNQYSMAIGYYAKAIGLDSYAIGSHAEAGGEKSFAIGSYGLNDDFSVNTGRPTRTSDYYSLAFGMGAQATKLGAMALGVNSTASGGQSVAIGFNSSANSQFSTAIGYRSIANGYKSIAIGAHYNITFNKLTWQYNASTGSWSFVPESVTLDKSNLSEGDYSIAIGNGNYSKVGGLSLGTNNNAFGFGSVALGHSNVADSAFSFAAGFSNSAIGLKGFALGENLIAQAANSFVIGAFNLAEGEKDKWLPNDPLFVVGNGNPGARSNAFKILKNGNIILSQTISSGTGLALSVDPLTGMILKAPSGSKYKTDINFIEDISWLYQLNPVSFIYKEDTSGRIQYGLIAEDVDRVNSALVFHVNGEAEGINYNSLIAPAIKALQDQKARIDDLTARNLKLEDENAELKNRLTTLEKNVNRLLTEK
jgi:hypothetical protein